MSSATTTYALLPVSAAAFDEVRSKLASAGYEHAFLDDATINMQGLALQRERPKSFGPTDQDVQP